MRPRRGRSHPDRGYSISGPPAHKRRDRNSFAVGLTGGAFIPGPNEDAKAIEREVQAFSPDGLLARYHDLVDRRFERELRYMEHFELERIEARLDSGSTDELERTAAIRQSWERERTDLVASLERLLAGFKAER